MATHSKQKISKVLVILTGWWILPDSLQGGNSILFTPIFVSFNPMCVSRVVVFFFKQAEELLSKFFPEKIEQLQMLLKVWGVVTYTDFYKEMDPKKTLFKY